MDTVADWIEFVLAWGPLVAAAVFAWLTVRDANTNSGGR